MTRQSILEKLVELRSKKTCDSSREAANSRAIDEPLLELVRQTSVKNLELFKFNDMTDHDIDVTPGTIWEDLNEFNCEYFDNKLQLEQNFEKQYFKLRYEDPETSKLEVKITFLDLKATEEEDDEDAPRRLRMRLVKKRGDLSQWYSIFKDMQDTVFEDTLLAPRVH